MAIVYFDASAMVKALLAEEDAALARQLWDECDVAVASRLVYPEVCAALAAAERNHSLARADAEAVREDWEAAWAAIRPVELSPAVARAAGEVARRHALRGADAVHLASAMAVAPAGLVMAVWDRQLHAGARSAGLAVAPATLSSN